LPKIEEGGKSWLRKPKLYKGVVEPYKKNRIDSEIKVNQVFYSNPEGS